MAEITACGAHKEALHAVTCGLTGGSSPVIWEQEEQAGCDERQVLLSRPGRLSVHGSRHGARAPLSSRRVPAVREHFPYCLRPKAVSKLLGI